MIREELIPKKDKEIEKALKTIILEIEDALGDNNKQIFIEKKIEEANKLLEASNRTIDIYTIENYYSWTSLDGFIGNLALQIPQKIELSEEEIIDLILYIQDTLIKSEDVEEYKFDFYFEYFINNYSEEIYNEIFMENVNVTELVRKIKNFQKSVITM